jgi:hypothetical protein
VLLHSMLLVAHVRNRSLLSDASQSGLQKISISRGTVSETRMQGVPKAGVALRLIVCHLGINMAVSKVVLFGGIRLEKNKVLAGDFLFARRSSSYPYFYSS